MIHAGSTAKMPRRMPWNWRWTPSGGHCGVGRSRVQPGDPLPGGDGQAGTARGLSEVPGDVRRWTSGCSPASTSVTSMPGPSVPSRPWRTMPRCWTPLKMPSVWTGPDRSHCHFSKIEYTQNGGEKRHLTFADTVYGPEFEPLARSSTPGIQSCGDLRIRRNPGGRRGIDAECLSKGGFSPGKRRKNSPFPLKYQRFTDKIILLKL